PTADGITAPFVGMTEPTVAPIPTWASGISATWPSMIGSRAVFSAWRIVSGSISLAHDSSFGLMVRGIGHLLCDCYHCLAVEASRFGGQAILEWPPPLRISFVAWSTGLRDCCRGRL